MSLKVKKLIFLLSCALFISLPQLSYSANGDCYAYFSNVKEEIVYKVSKDKPAFIQEYQTQSGYLRFTESLQKPVDMTHVFRIVSKLLTKNQMRQLKWQAVQGTTKDYNELKDKILDRNGNIKTEFIGMDGYALFADTHFSGNMLKAFKNISAVLGGVHAMRELGLNWKQFLGFSSQYYGLKKMFDNYGVKSLKGLEGQDKVAKEIFKGNTRKAYDSVSILRENLLGNRKAFNELKWLR